VDGRAPPAGETRAPSTPRGQRHLCGSAMGPVVRSVHESLDVLGEKMTTTIAGDAWDGATFEVTDAGGGMSGTLDGAWLLAVCVHRRRAVHSRADAAWLRQGCASAGCTARCTRAAKPAQA